METGRTGTAQMEMGRTETLYKQQRATISNAPSGGLKESRFSCALGRINAAFENLENAVKRVEISFAPVLNPTSPQVEKTATVPPMASNAFDALIDEITGRMSGLADNIFSYCDRSSIG